ncbi:MAG TPA: DUF2782 domain-containing protein [Casimicrobiaceae bacterium]|jgi:hypothetical protein
MNPPRLAVPALAAMTFAAVALAQPAPPPPPLPPESATTGSPSAAVAGDPELEPQVTIIRRDTETLEEVRIGGELKFVKVTPRTGRPYYLIPDQGGRQFIRRDSLDPTLRVPMWVLFSW